MERSMRMLLTLAVMVSSIPFFISPAQAQPGRLIDMSEIREELNNPPRQPEAAAPPAQEAIDTKAARLAAAIASALATRRLCTALPTEGPALPSARPGEPSFVENFRQLLEGRGWTDCALNPDALHDILSRPEFAAAHEDENPVAMGLMMAEALRPAFIPTTPSMDVRVHNLTNLARVITGASPEPLPAAAPLSVSALRLTKPAAAPGLRPAAPQTAIEEGDSEPAAAPGLRPAAPYGVSNITYMDRPKQARDGIVRRIEIEIPDAQFYGNGVSNIMDKPIINRHTYAGNADIVAGDISGYMRKSTPKQRKQVSRIVNEVMAATFHFDWSAAPSNRQDVG